MKKLNYTKKYVGNINEILSKKKLVSDNIDLTEFTRQTNDFQEQDFTVLHGPITRDGGFDYIKDGKKVTLYKQWDNIKERYNERKYLPLRATIEKGSHHAEEVGFAYNWKPNEETKQMFADIVLIQDIETMTRLLNPKEGYHVSMGFEDHIEDGNKQIIDSLDHIAMSLENKEVGRCSTDGGESCTVKKKVQGIEMKA